MASPAGQDPNVFRLVIYCPSMPQAVLNNIAQAVAASLPAGDEVILEVRIGATFEQTRAQLGNFDTLAHRQDTYASFDDATNYKAAPTAIPDPITVNGIDGLPGSVSPQPQWGPFTVPPPVSPPVPPGTPPPVPVVTVPPVVSIPVPPPPVTQFPTSPPIHVPPQPPLTVPPVTPPVVVVPPTPPVVPPPPPPPTPPVPPPPTPPPPTVPPLPIPPPPPTPPVVIVPPTPPPISIYTFPPTVGPNPVPLTANLTIAKASFQPWYIGYVSTTFGARPDNSGSQKTLEHQLDARLVRIPIGWRNGRVTGSAGGGPTDFDMKTLVDIYRADNCHIVGVIGGQTSDIDVQSGDATKIYNALGNSNIMYTPPNEPDNGYGLSDQDVVNKALAISDELKGLNSSIRMLGPVWVDFKRGSTQTYINGIGSGRIQGVDWHHYAYGGDNYPGGSGFGQAMSTAAGFESSISQTNTDLGNAGIPKYTCVDEFNYCWDSSGPGGFVNEFYQAENTLWIASSIGHMLNVGGSGCVFGSQNGALGVWTEGGNDDNGKGQGTPMPAYYGLAMWTGARAWSHFNNAAYNTTSASSDIEIFAVNNEAGGYNLVVINKSQSTDHNVTITLSTNSALGGYDLFQTVRANPYSAPVKTSASSGWAIVGNQISFTAKACTVSTVVCKA